MVEPIGLVGTLIAIAQVCSKLVSVCYDYHIGVRDAPQDISRILDEISSVGAIAQQLVKISSAEHGSALPVLREMDKKDGPLPKALSELQELKQSLKLGKPSSRRRRDLVWPLKRAEADKKLQAIALIKSTLQLALAADNAQNTAEILGSTRLLPSMERKVNELVVSQEASDKDSRRRKLLDELTGCNQSDKFQSQYQKCAPGTGEWFVCSPQYKEWRVSTGGILWVNGMAGSGKTVLCSKMINDLRNHCAAERSSMCYFFEDASLDKTVGIDSVYKVLTRQLLEQGTSMRPSVSYTAGWQRVFYDVLEKSSSTYIVFDGIDECDEPSQVGVSGMVQLIKKIIKSCPPGKVRIAIFSRDLEQLREEFGQLGARTVRIDPTATRKDMQTAVQHELSIQRKFARCPDSLKKTIEATLLAQAHGSFRWLDCQLQELGRCKTPQAVKSTLNSLPISLEEHYGRVLNRFDEATRAPVKNLLLWVTFSLRPLSITEVAKAIAIEVNGLDVPYYDPELELFDPEGFIDSCSTLVTTFQIEEKDHSDKQKVYVKLAHFTVREYLTSDAAAEEPRSSFYMEHTLSNMLLAKACLAFFHYAVKSSPDGVWSPLVSYAGHFWVRHKQNSGGYWQVFGLEPLLKDLFDSKQPFFKRWMEVANIDRPWLGETSDTSFTYTALYCAAYCGLPRIVQELIAEGEYPDIPSGLYGYPLQAAALNGHAEVVQILIEENADVSAEGGAQYTALSAAASKGHMDIAKILLEAGAPVNISRVRGSLESTDPLYLSVVNGHLQMCEMLLKHGAEDYHALKGYPPSALVAAVDSGRIDIVKALLRYERVVEGHQGDSMTSQFAAGFRSGFDNAQWKAAAHKHVNILRELLAYGAHKDDALGFAAMAGDQQTVRQYLEDGADPGSSTLTGSVLDYKGIPKPLACAAYWGRLDIVRELLSYGVDPNDQTSDGVSSLTWAVKGGNIEIVELLITSGADVNLDSPLAAACSMQRTDLIDLLIRHGTSIHGVLREAAQRSQLEVFNHALELGADLHLASTEKHPSLLALATSGGSAPIIQYLLDHGLQSELNPSPEQILPLHIAISSKQSQTVELLIGRGADVNAYSQTIDIRPPRTLRPTRHWTPMPETPLTLAARIGSKEVIDLLMQNGAMVTPPTPASVGTPLLYAVWHQDTSLVERLIAQCVDVNQQGTLWYEDIPTFPLLLATEEDSLDILGLLLDAGAEINVQNVEGFSALHIAAARETSDQLKLILSRPGVNINLRLSNGSVPLHSAASEGGVENVISLLSAGAHINVLNNTGRTPLHWAAANGNWEVVESLLDRGAAAEIKSMDDGAKTALDLAHLGRETPTWAIPNSAASWDDERIDRLCERLAIHLS